MTIIITNKYLPQYLLASSIQGNVLIDVDSRRKGVMVSYFCLFAIYLVVISYKRYLVNKGNSEIEKPGSINYKAKEKLEDFQTNFLLFFSHHLVCSLMALLWAPYDFALTCFFFNIIFFLCYCIADLYEKLTLKQFFFGVMAVLNIALIIAGCRGIQQNQLYLANYY